MARFATQCCVLAVEDESRGKVIKFLFLGMRGGRANRQRHTHKQPELNH